jgi:threonine synthase
MAPEAWVEHDSDNPFVRFRELLLSYEAARRKGWRDGQFVEMVERLDAQLAGVAGSGFVMTPFAVQDDLGGAIGIDTDLWVKDETGNVAGSHKARHLFGLALWLEVEGAGPAGRLAIASCGNAALGAATIAGAAQRPIDVYIPTWADPTIVDMLSGLGAELHICERRDGEDGDPCIHRFREAVAAGSRPFGVQATDSPMTLDGGRTVGFEMIATGPVPDHVFVQVGGGALATCVGLAYEEGVRRGRIDSLPALHPVQTEGCAPFERAWSLLVPRLSDDVFAALAYARANPDEFMWPWEHEPASAATGIIDDMTYDWLPLAEQTARSGGQPVVAPESVVVRAHEVARANTEIPVDATGTAGLAGLMAWLDEHPQAAADSCAVLFTGLDRSVG